MNVKTAISIPDSLFEEADRLAKRRGWLRSELYANAVTAYVNNERFAGVREKKVNLLQPIVNGSAPLLWQIHLAKERSVAGVRLEVL
jgi:metal-responsive CopG/Arc/MetJ family transcriptional regulator